MQGMAGSALFTPHLRVPSELLLRYIDGDSIVSVFSSFADDVPLPRRNAVPSAALRDDKL